jgi:hypothetical protein
MIASLKNAALRSLAALLPRRMLMRALEIKVSPDHLCVFGQGTALSDIRRVLYRRLSVDSTFTFGSCSLKYFFHTYNSFGLNERSVEIPIVRHFLDQHPPQDILEIGNVTNHYYESFKSSFSSKVVVDLSERAHDVLNIDIADFNPDRIFPLIISISTFEHMDSDRGKSLDHIKGSSQLVSKAADNIRHVVEDILAPGGRFVLTAPLGYTPEWDETFHSDFLLHIEHRRHSLHVLQKLGEMKWREVAPESARGVEYNSPLGGANFLSVIVIDK